MKTVLITGASQGLGRALARLLASRGYRLVLNARRPEPLQEIAWELGALAIPGDVSEIAEELATRAGRVDVLINNASELGPLPMPRLEDYPWDVLLHVFKVNAVAPLHLTQLLLPQMKARGEGLILNISSDAATNAYPGWGGYGASKAALEHLSRTLAVELEGTGVRVEIVDPGEMATQMHRDAIDGGDVSHLPSPESVAPRIVTLIDAQKGGGGVIAYDFELPRDLEAREPAELRGSGRDDVRLLVTSRADDSVTHAHFRDLPKFLRAGDLVVLNTTATLPAAVDNLHISTALPGGLVIVEPRGPHESIIRLPGEVTVTLLAPYRDSQRLWIARFDGVGDLRAYLERYGRPIAYSYIDRSFPIDAYQTVFADEPGSAEMPSAGRAFTRGMLVCLRRRGVRLAKLVLHAGVASLESHEPPYEEQYEVPVRTSDEVRRAKERGGRVVAVGTTVVRALESSVDRAGHVIASRGWTDLVITPERGLRVVDGLLTGLHEPRATHLAMLEALAGREHVEKAYAAALAQRYLWHEFGDLHLIL